MGNLPTRAQARLGAGWEVSQPMVLPLQVARPNPHASSVSHLTYGSRWKRGIGHGFKIPERNCQMTARSPNGPMLRDVRMCAITREPKTFNNCLGFERGLWQHQTRCFAAVPKRRVFGAILNARFADGEGVSYLLQKWPSLGRSRRISAVLRKASLSVFFG